MTTKKPDKTKTGQEVERGRFARMLAGGYTIEAKPKTAKPSPATPSKS